MANRHHHAIESLPAAGSRTRSIDDPQTTNENTNQRPDRNESRPQSSASMFSGIQQLHINGGIFTQNIYNYQNVPLKSLPRSHDAAFSAAINSDNLSRRRCTEGTRVEIIAQIMEWAKENDPTKVAPVYWLTGLAGLGKTTIAYTICELLEEARLPFVSFFCSLQLDSGNSKLLVTTLCGDLAELYNSYAARVSHILEKNSKVMNARLRIQIEELLAKPWQASIAEGTNDDEPTPIIVVDALDESDRGTEFLEELLRVIRAGQLVGIKFLVTSRLDPKIVELSKSFPPNAVCKLHEVDTTDVQNDIEKYLREALPELQDEPELSLLSNRAGGLFIYATTAVRFISPPYSPPSISEMRSHLQDMLDLGPSTSYDDSDERLLVDELYERILGDAFRDARVRATRLQILHTFICAQSRIDMSVLTTLTNTDEGTVKKVVESLHAVLYVSSKDGCVYWYHASFPEFLFSRARARITIVVVQRSYPTYHEIDVFCDPPVRHSILAQRCLSVLEKSLHFNMCNLPSSYIFDSDVPGLNASVNKTFSPTFRYVSRNWARHLLQADPPENDTHDLFRCLKRFVGDKLLFWIEAMNLIDAKFECPSLLNDAGSWLEKEQQWPDLMASLTDAANFSAFFAGSPASKSTPHLYISALSTWDHDSVIWRNWRDRFRFIPSISLPRGSITIPLMTILSSHPVNCIAFSPDGSLIVAGSNGDVGTYRNSLLVWDVKTGEQLRELRGHTHVVHSVAYSPDGSRIVSSSLDFSIRVWDAKTGEQQRKLPGDSKTLAFSPDGSHIVSGYYNSVRIWNVKTGEQHKELKGHNSSVTSAAFSSDGSEIVSGSHDKSVRVWNAKTGEQLRELRGHTGVVTSVAFLPDSNQIVSGSWDHSVRLWDKKTGKHLRELRGHTNIVTSIASSSDGNRIISGSWDHSIRVWDTRTGELQRELQGHTGIVSAVVLSPDGNRITSGSWDKSIRSWSAEMGNHLKPLQGHANVVASVAFLSDGDRIVSGSLDNSVRIWNTKTGEQLEEGQGHMQDDRITSVAFSPDGKRAVSGFENGSVRVWDSRTGEQLMSVQGHNNKVTAVAFSPNGDQIISGSEARSLRVWDANTGEHRRKLQGHFMQVFWAAFSPDGSRIISGSDGLRMWDAITGEHLMELQGHSSYVTSGAFSHDGKQIVSGSHDKSVRVWDAETGNQLRVLQGHTGRVTSVAFSLDRNQIVSGSEDKSVRIWDVGTGKLHRELRGHTSHVTSVAFSPDGNRIVSGSFDQSLRVWAHLNLSDDPWVMNETGWILSGGEILVWVPSTIRNVLLRPHNTLVISRNGSASISFEQCRFGLLWHECYTP